jgi:hypothetical protein
MTETGSVQRLLDRAAIEELSGTYLRGLDRRDAELIASVFHPDASAHYGAFTGGPGQFVAMALEALARYPVTQHLRGQVNLWFAPDDPAPAPRRATGEVYFQAFHRSSGADGIDLFICGRYVDRYECRDGEWRIAHRTEVVDWARSEPTSDDYLKNRPHLVTGHPDRTDLSYRIGDN